MAKKRKMKREPANRNAALKGKLSVVLQWSSDEPVQLSRTMICVIAMAVSILFGILFNNLRFGLLASFGAMIVSGDASEGRLRQHAIDLLRTMLAGTAAIFTGILIGNQNGVAEGWIVVISVLAAVFGGISRPAAKACAQFTIFAIIGTGMGSGGNHPYIISLYFAIGSLIGILVSLSFILLFHSRTTCGKERPSVQVTTKQRLKRWRHTLAQRSGWEFPARMALCMTAAPVIGTVLHLDRSYWIALTVAIVLQRRLSSGTARIFQRGFGTAAGVLAGSLLLLWMIPQWGVLLIVALLAALRPIFKKRSYTIYSMLMTPIMVMMFSMNSPVTESLLFSRLLDTFIGCGITLVLGHYIWPNSRISRLQEAVNGGKSKD